MNTLDSILTLVRPDILALTPYSSARKEFSATVGGALCPDSAQPIWLDANENPITPSAGGPLLNRYPEPQPPALVTRLASLYGVTPSGVLVTRGSDEGIDLLLRAFCRADRDAILITPPTYGVYAVAAAIQGARVLSVPLARESAFALDPSALLAGVTAETKIVFLCSPNNPTGQLLERSAVVSTVRALARRAMVVVDEAYLEFADAPSLATELAANPNLVVLRTLSKAHGLAGARVGALLAAPALISVLQKIIAPYPVPMPVTLAALAALTPAGLAATRDAINRLVAERQRLSSALSKLPCVRRLWPSDANFLLVEFDDASRVLSAARAAGLVLRDRRKDVPNALRITIGTPAENDLVLATFARLPGNL